jgi:hypothetical protein
MTYTCSVCKEIKTEEIAKLEHTKETVQGKAPSCTEPGLTDGVKCSVCQTVITAQTTIPTTEHQYDENGNCSCGASQSTPKFTVTFNVDGNLTEVEVESGNTVNKPADPEKSDYTFKHWTLNGQEYNFSSPVTESIELVAVFEKVVLQPTTVTITMSNNNWTNGTKYSNITVDDNITITASTAGNNGKYYSSDRTWRIYQSDSGTFTIKAAEGKTIVSIIIVYKSSNNGYACHNSTKVASGSTYTVNANSIQLSAKTTTSGKSNGQVLIQYITIVYQ